MANGSFVLRIRSGSREFTPSTSSVNDFSTEKIKSAVETLLNGKWQVVGDPVTKPGSENFDFEVRVDVAPKAIASPSD
jgi:hypothetical protein